MNFRKRTVEIVKKLSPGQRVKYTVPGNDTIYKGTITYIEYEDVEGGEFKLDICWDHINKVASYYNYDDMLINRLEVLTDQLSENNPNRTFIERRIYEKKA